eukprot:GILK01014466.1.p1 GENE.GILK01014466.1~~GILK01014466.1.p1  ORF type:complete len:614 (-),score=68.88 GILK01014466.1:12-1853(-)
MISKQPMVGEASLQRRSQYERTCSFPARTAVGGFGRGQASHARTTQTMSALRSDHAISDVQTREQVRGVRKRSDVILKAESHSKQNAVALQPTRPLAHMASQESELSKDDRRKLQEEKVQKEREQFERNRQQRALGELKKKQETQTAAVSLLRRCSRFTAHTGYWDEGALDLKEILELALGKEEFAVQCAVHQQRLDRIAKHLLQPLATHPDPMPQNLHAPTSQRRDAQPAAVSRFVNDFTGSDPTVSASRPSAVQAPLSRVIGSPVRASAVHPPLSVFLPPTSPPASDPHTAGGDHDGSAELQRPQLSHLNIHSISKQEPINEPPPRCMQMSSSTLNQPLSESASHQAPSDGESVQILGRSHMIPLGVEWPAGMPIATPYGYMVPSWQVLPAAAAGVPVGTDGIGFMNYGMDGSQPTMYPSPASNMFFPFASPAQATESPTGSSVGGLWVPNYPHWQVAGSWMPYVHTPPDQKLDWTQNLLQEELAARARHNASHRHPPVHSTTELPPTSYDPLLPQTSTIPATQTSSPVHWFLNPSLVPNMNSAVLPVPAAHSSDFMFAHGTRETRQQRAQHGASQTDPRHRRPNADRGRNRRSGPNRSFPYHNQESNITN